MKFLRHFLIACVCLVPAQASSATFTIPPDAKRLAVTIPDVLEPTDTLAGAEGASNETRAFYVDIEPLKAHELKPAIDESVEILGQHGIMIDPESLKQNEGKINNLNAVDLSFTVISGKEKAAITLISTKPGDFFALVEFGSEEWLGNNAQVVKSIRDSIKPAK